MQTELSLSTVTATQEQVDAILRELLPAQGQWSEADYLWLTGHTSRLIEFTDGYLEVLPMPTDEHQTMVLLLYELLVAFVRPRGGKVLVAPLRLKIRDGKYREPDIVLVRSARDPRRQNRFWLGADLRAAAAPSRGPERCRTACVQHCRIMPDCDAECANVMWSDLAAATFSGLSEFHTGRSLSAHGAALAGRVRSLGSSRTARFIRQGAG